MEKVKAKKPKNLKSLMVTLSVVLAVVLSIIITLSVHNYTPSKNYYGNGNEWAGEASTYALADYNSTPTLKWLNKRSDNELKILHLADPQMKFGDILQDVKTMDLITKALDESNPDIAVVTGDLTLSIFARSAVKYFAEYMEARKQYWAFTYGNHDSEYSLSKYRTAELLSNYKYCLFDGGPSNIKGESNYFIKVIDSSNKLMYLLSMIDSNMYPESNTAGGSVWEYDWVSKEQISWYKWNIEGINKLVANNEVTAINANISSSMFMHIPLIQLADAYVGSKNGSADVTDASGFILEADKEDGAAGIYHQGRDDGMFDAVKQLNSTKGIFFGHDHVNNFRANYKGIMLSYGRSCGYHTYPFFERANFLTEMLGLADTTMYNEDMWVDDEGNKIGRGVTFIDVSMSQSTYGEMKVYDKSHKEYNA